MKLVPTDNYRSFGWCDVHRGCAGYRHGHTGADWGTMFCAPSGTGPTPVMFICRHCDPKWYATVHRNHRTEKVQLRAERKRTESPRERYMRTRSSRVFGHVLVED